MNKILDPIPPQTFEIITVDILNILNTEFTAQADPLLNAVEFFYERISPIDKVDLPGITVRYAGSRNRLSSRLEQNLTNIYYIDCFTSSKVTDSQDSDVTSATSVQRLMGAVRWVLMHPGYYKLGFSQSIIESTVITSIEMGDQRDNRDTETTMWGRVVFEVNAAETSEPIPVGILSDYRTLAQLFGSNSGYEWLVEKTT